MTAALAASPLRLVHVALCRAAPALLVAPLVAYLLIFYALPLASMPLRSVSDPTWTMESFWKLTGDTVFLRVFWATLRTSFAVTTTAVCLGYPVALAMSRTQRTPASVVLIIVRLPFWTSVLVRSYACMVLLGRKGLINEALIATSIIDSSLKLQNTPLAIHIAMTHILLPYMILPIDSVLRQLDPALPRAPSGLGASPWSVFIRIILPLSMPGSRLAYCSYSYYRLDFILRQCWSEGPGI
jgi:ABC-type spermidine/putrescine transport system permease subunit I